MWAAVLGALAAISLITLVIGAALWRYHDNKSMAAFERQARLEKETQRLAREKESLRKELKPAHELQQDLQRSREREVALETRVRELQKRLDSVTGDEWHANVQYHAEQLAAWLAAGGSGRYYYRERLPAPKAKKGGTP